MDTAITTLRLDVPPPIASIPELCRKGIADIIKAAKHRLRARKERQENARYDNNVKSYHRGMKIQAAVLPNPKIQPTLKSARHPLTKEVTNEPEEVINIVRHYFDKALRRATAEHPGDPPWETSENPDNFTLSTSYPLTDIPQSMSDMLNRGHYNTAIRKLATGKAPGPDGIPNEIIRYLPTQMHDLIYNFFKLSSRIEYIPYTWCVSATCLIYKPHKQDPHNPGCYRPIALMNCILKLWTSILAIIGVELTEPVGTINDHQDGFRFDRQTNDSLMTHIHALEDAKKAGKDIFSSFVDFKSAFNGTDHRQLFTTMRELGLPQWYTNCCRQVYEASSTYYCTPHGNTAPISIDRGTLQGDTLSPFLFILFLEPLMRWLKIGSRGYKPSTATGPSPSDGLHVTYDEHGYADDLSITTGTLADMKVQLRKLYLFSTYTGLELEIPKCEVTGALWSRGNPILPKNLTLLETMIDTIDLTGEPNGPQLKFLPPNESYKMLGVHINPLLNFTEHYDYITKDVKALAAVLKRRQLSPDRKRMVIMQLLRSKYHAVHLGVFNDTQLRNIDSILNSALRNAYRLLPSFPTEGLYRTQDSYGLGHESIQNKIALMGTEQLIRMANMPTERGYITFQHVKGLANTYKHWPLEALNDARVSVPTLRILSSIAKLPNTELAHLETLLLSNPIAETLRKVSKMVDDDRRTGLTTLHLIRDKAEYKHKYSACQPLKYSNRILKHLIPIWDIGIYTWNEVLAKQSENIVFIPPTVIISRRARNTNITKTQEKTAITALHTLFKTLSHPAATHHKTLPRTYHTRTKPHTDCPHSSWLPHIPADTISEYIPVTYSTMMSHAEHQPPSKSKQLKATHSHEDYMQLCDDAPTTEFDVLEVVDHKIKLGQTLYLTIYSEEFLTQPEIHEWQAPPNNFVIKTKTPTDTTDPDSGLPLFRIEWQAAWQSKEALLTQRSGHSVIERYKTNLRPKKRMRRNHPPPGRTREKGWHTTYCTFNVAPINPDLDIHPTGKAEINYHPTDITMAIVHNPTGQAKYTLSRDRLDMLYTHYIPRDDTTFEEDVLRLAHRILAPKKTKKREHPDCSDHDDDPLQLPDPIYECLNAVLPIERALNADPLRVPLGIPAYHSRHSSDLQFSALPLDSSYAWPGTSLSIPQTDPSTLRYSLENAIYAAHKFRHNFPTATFLVLPDKQNSPYMSKNLHTSYVQRILRFPNLRHPPLMAQKTWLNVYLIANRLALSSIDIPTTLQLINTSLKEHYPDQHLTLRLSNPQDDIAAPTIDSMNKYSVPPPTLLAPASSQPTIRYYPSAHPTRWDPKDFIYTDGSLVTGTEALGAGISYPRSGLTVSIKVEATPERHTINRAELAALAQVLIDNKDAPLLSILTDSAFCIYSIQNYINAPASHQNNLHTALLEFISSLLRYREKSKFHTHFGKVKSHTGVAYNEVADMTANGVATGRITEPDVIFTLANPPMGGLRTWPQKIVHNPKTPGNPDRTPFGNLKTDIRKITRLHPQATAYKESYFGKLLCDSQAKGADYSIHAHSRSSFKNRTNSLQIAWGTYRNKYKHLQKKSNPDMHLRCKQCGKFLTNSHLAGNCPSLERLRMSRHHSTFTLFEDILAQSNVGRWPIISMDLGNKPSRNFETLLSAEISKPPDTDPEINTVDTQNGLLEGVESWKTDSPYPTVIPQYLLPREKLPQHHKPDMIRATGYTLDDTTGRLTRDLTFHGRRALQLIECKFSTDTNMDEIYHSIKQLYEPLKRSILEHGWWDDPIDIIPIVLSRTGSFHVKTLGEIAQLVSWQEEPPPITKYKDLTRDARKIAQALHTHAQDWLTLILSVSSARLIPSKRSRQGTKKLR